MGRGARKSFSDFAAGKSAAAAAMVGAGAQPMPGQLPALHLATLRFAGDCVHRAAPTTTWEFPRLREWSLNTSGPRNLKTLKVKEAWSWFYIREMHQPI